MIQESEEIGDGDSDLPMKLIHEISKMTGITRGSQSGDISTAVWVSIPMSYGRILTIQTHDSYGFIVRLESQ